MQRILDIILLCRLFRYTILIVACSKLTTACSLFLYILRFSILLTIWYFWWPQLIIYGIFSFAHMLSRATLAFEVYLLIIFEFVTEICTVLDLAPIPWQSLFSTFGSIAVSSLLIIWFIIYTNGARVHALAQHTTIVFLIVILSGIVGHNAVEWLWRGLEGVRLLGNGRRNLVVSLGVKDRAFVLRYPHMLLGPYKIKYCNYYNILNYISCLNLYYYLFWSEFASY